MSGPERYLDQRVRRLELRELELAARERKLADDRALAGSLVMTSAERILDLEEQLETARRIAARLEAETAACPMWVCHRIDDLDEPTDDELAARRDRP